MSGVFTELWPYIALILVGYLPNEVWRMLGVAVSHGIDENSELLIWVRAVATAVLAGVVAQLVVDAPGALALVPLPVRLSALAVGFLTFLAIKRSVFAGVMGGQAAMLIGGYLSGVAFTIP